MAKKTKTSEKRASAPARRRPAKSRGTAAKKEPRTEKQEKKGAAAAGARRSSGKETDLLKGFTQTSSRLVQQAASILEEEIARGILAAKKVEENFIRVNEIRSAKPDELMQRFRRDAHEVIDIVLDLLTAATNYVGDFSQRVITVRTAKDNDNAKNLTAGKLPTLILPKSIKPGGSAEVTMTLENDSEHSTEEFSFLSTDLVNSSGDRLAAKNIVFNPPTLKIGPHKKENVVVAVNAPKVSAAGVFSGLIQATKMGQVRAVLVAQID